MTGYGEFTQPAGTALAPDLTPYDQRVLAALDQWHSVDDRPPSTLDWRDLWDIARTLREHDLTILRGTLDGLAHLGHALARGHDHNREWIATPWRQETTR